MIKLFLQSSASRCARFALPAALGIALLAGSGPAHAQGRAGSQTTMVERQGPLEIPVANPADVVAAEQSFARAVQEKGQWTAFNEYAADNAVMFVPEAVKAR